MSGRQRRAEEIRDIRHLVFQRGEEDDPGYAELLEGTPCPECRSSGGAKPGIPCEFCFGEGELG